MFEALEAHVARRAEVRAEMAAERIAASIHVPGVQAETTQGGVVLSGRGLMRRWINDARLRWIAGWSA
ncbi:hypothetical protein [Stakelama flava]|nr:hypothetical protein [Stakelama flava]